MLAGECTHCLPTPNKLRTAPNHLQLTFSNSFNVFSRAFESRSVRAFFKFDAELLSKRLAGDFAASYAPHGEASCVAVSLV